MDKYVYLEVLEMELMSTIHMHDLGKENVESKFNLFGSNGRQYCWKRNGERRFDQHVQPTAKFGGEGVSILVWECMNWEGVGNLRLIERKMDKYVYLEVLEMELMSTIHMHDSGKENVTFQHDNDPKHTSKYVTNWLLAQKFQLMLHLV
jgi:hypothetical protein